MSFLVSIHLEDVAKEQNLITLKETDTIRNALVTFAKYKISSAPLVNEGGKQQGVVDILDLLYYVTDKFDMTQKGVPKPDEKKIDEFFNRPIQKLQGFSNRNPLIFLGREKSLIKAIRNLGFPGWVRRIAIGDAQRIEGILTQSKAMEIIWKYKDEVSDILKFRVRELWPEARQTKTIGMNDSLLSAFEKIRLDRVSGLAVTNQHGILVGNVSASDLKYASSQANAAQFLHYLSSPLSEFLKNKGELGGFKFDPVVAKLDDTLEFLIQKFVDTKVHRIYIVDEQKKPLQVITLGDILAQFSHLDILKGIRA